MNRMGSIIGVILVLFGAAGPVAAGWEEGVAAFKAGNYAQAAREFQGVVEGRPEWPGGHYMLGQSLLKLNRNDEALTHLRKAYDLNPNDVNYQLALAKAYLEVRRYGDAAKLLSQINDRALSRQQQLAYQRMLAVAMEKTGRTDQALEALRKVARASPEDANIQYKYGLAAFNAGATAEAVTALERAVRLDGKDPEKRETYIQVLIRSARETTGTAKTNAYLKAAEAAEVLATQQPTYDNLLLRGETQLGAGQYREAISSFNQAAAKKSNDWLTHFYIGQAQTALGQYSEADASLKRAMEAGPPAADQKRVWRQIGFVNEKLKNFSRAKEAYRNAGDTASLARVEENERIEEENRKIEEENERIRRLEEERRKLEEELKELPPPF